MIDTMIKPKPIALIIGVCSNESKAKQDIPVKNNANLKDDY